MATTRPFAYNTGSTISGTIQVGNIAIGVTDQDYSQNPGGVKWWMGPDEELGYVVVNEVAPGDHPTPVEVDAYLNFWRSTDLTEQSLIDLLNVIPITNGLAPFTNISEVQTWLADNGHFTTYGNNLPTPTPTATSVLPTATPTPTPTATSQPCNPNFNVSNCGTSHVYNAETGVPWDSYGNDGTSYWLQVGPSQSGGGSIAPQAGWYFVDECGIVQQLLSTPIWVAPSTPSPYPNGTGWLCAVGQQFTISSGTTTLTFCETLPTVTFVTPTPTATNAPTGTPTPTPTPVIYQYGGYYQTEHSSTYDACQEPLVNGVTLWGSTPTFSVGDTLYTISDLSNPFIITTPGKYVKITDTNNDEFALTTDTNGVITFMVLCSTLPTPTATPVPPTGTPTPTPTATPEISTLNIEIGYSILNVIFDNVTYTSNTTINVVKNQQYTAICGSGNFDTFEGTGLAPLVPNAGNIFVTITGNTATLRAVSRVSAPTSTPTPTVTSTPTPTPTSTSVPTSTPTPTATDVPPTPTPTPTDVVSCGGIPYTLTNIWGAPTSGNTLWVSTSAGNTASNEVNKLAISTPFFINKIDSDGVDRTSYFSDATGNTFTITICQNGNSAIYSGITGSILYNGTSYFEFDATKLHLVQSSPVSAFTFNELVYFDLSVGIQPTPTPTSTENPTPTPTPTNPDCDVTYNIVDITPTPTPTPSSTNPDLIVNLWYGGKVCGNNTIQWNTKTPSSAKCDFIEALTNNPSPNFQLNGTGYNYYSSEGLGIGTQLYVEVGGEFNTVLNSGVLIHSSGSDVNPSYLMDDGPYYVVSWGSDGIITGYTNFNDLPSCGTYSCTTPTPTATSTSTPTATPTPTATDVPNPTNTPTPTATDVPPTATPVPSTPTPTPTATTASSPMTVTITEVGSNVVMTASGTVDLTGLTLVESNFGPIGGGGLGINTATFICGNNGTYVTTYSGFTSVPSNFGFGSYTPPASSASGNYFGVIMNGQPPYFLLVPTGYTSGTNISSTLTFNNTTLSTLGLTVGTYTYTWSGGSIDVVVGTGLGGPTPTPTATSSGGVGTWYFYSDAGMMNAGAPSGNGNALFWDQTTGMETFDPNYVSGHTFQIYLNPKDSTGTSYLTQFSGLTTGGTITLSQNGDTATYVGASGTMTLAGPPGSQFFVMNFSGGSGITQTKTSNAPFVYADPISITFGS